jgi:hypothetical protein
MNILNQAIDSESVQVLEYLVELILSLPDPQPVITHRFGKKEMQAIHQVMTLGELYMIKLMVL